MAVPRSRGSSDQDVLCALLRDRRARAGLTQVQVAGRLGRPQSYVSKYESGERRLDLVELAEVCSALEVGLVDLISEWQSAAR